MAEATAEAIAARTTRYSDTLPIEVMQSQQLAIVGVGAIGRQVALQLASMGVLNVDIWDHDTVEPHNMGVQGFRPDQIGMPKVTATEADMLAQCPEMLITATADKFTPSTYCDAQIVFACVDTMSGRQQISDRDDCILIDARMNAEFFDIVTVDLRDPDQREWYKSTLCDDADTEQGRCTARSTMYCASIAAGYMVSTWANWIREVNNPRRIQVDLPGKGTSRLA
jgi:molybdopterin/thiamine biosynthesis adenylyltransferase